MKATPSYLIGAAIFCGCAASVWALRGGHALDAASSASSESSSRMATKTSRSASGKVGVPVEVTERLASVRAGRTIEDRMRATIQLAESIPIGDLEKWFKEEWFDGHEDMQGYLFYRIARARWLAADPEGLMRYNLREKADRLYEVAVPWTEKDPAAALSFATGLKNPEQRSNFLSSIGFALAKADPQLAIDRISALAESFDANQMRSTLSEIIRGLTESSPGLLKEKLDELPDSLRATARGYLTRDALKRDFRSAVAELGKSATGKIEFAEAMRSGHEMMQEMLKNPDALPRGWFAEAASRAGFYVVRDDPGKWLHADLASMDFSPEQASTLRSQALYALTEKDPEQVIAMLSEQQLPESERFNAVQAVAAKMASDKEKAEAWIATLTDEKEIEAAKRSIASRNEIQEKEFTPTSLLSKLAEDGTSAEWSQARAVSQWDGEERAALSREFAALPPEQKQKVASKFLESSREFPATLKADALRYLLDHPPSAEDQSPGNKSRETMLVRAASAIGSSWAEENPNEASRWVSSLPAGTERLWAAKNLAARWAEYEPAEARKWLDSLPSEERTAVQKYLDSGEAYR